MKRLIFHYFPFFLLFVFCYVVFQVHRCAMQKACACSDSVATAIVSIINPASMPVEDDKVRQLLIGASTLAHGIHVFVTTG